MLLAGLFGRLVFVQQAGDLHETEPGRQKTRQGILQSLFRTLDPGFDGKGQTVMLIDILIERSDDLECSGQQKLATALEFFQYRFSDSFGGNPPL